MSNKNSSNPSFLRRFISLFPFFLFLVPFFPYFFLSLNETPVISRQWGSVLFHEAPRRRYSVSPQCVAERSVNASVRRDQNAEDPFTCLLASIVPLYGSIVVPWNRTQSPRFVCSSGNLLLLDKTRWRGGRIDVSTRVHSESSLGFTKSTSGSHTFVARFGQLFHETKKNDFPSSRSREVGLQERAQEELLSSLSLSLLCLRDPHRRRVNAAKTHRSPPAHISFLSHLPLGDYIIPRHCVRRTRDASREFISRN